MSSLLRFFFFFRLVLLFWFRFPGLIFSSFVSYYAGLLFSNIQFISWFTSILRFAENARTEQSGMTTLGRDFKFSKSLSWMHSLTKQTIYIKLLFISSKKGKSTPKAQYLWGNNACRRDHGAIHVCLTCLHVHKLTLTLLMKVAQGNPVVSC